MNRIISNHDNLNHLSQQDVEGYVVSVATVDNVRTGGGSGFSLSLLCFVL